MKVAYDILLKSSQRGLQLCLRLHLNWRFAHKVMHAHKVAGIPTLGILGFPFESPGTKCHLDVGPVANHRVYYKGVGDGFPQVRAMVSFVSSSLPMARPSTKSASTMH